MSKYILRKRTTGFTTVTNNVIHVLKGNLEALGFYLYLLSLPNDWNFHKTHLCKEFSIGIKKLEKLLKILSSVELIQYGQKRNEQGRFDTFYIDIYDTESIKINKLQNSSPVGQNCRTVITDGRSGEATKEEIQNKHKIIKNSCSTDVERNGFKEFWETYPRKQKKKVTERLWIKNKLHLKKETIISTLKARLETEWKGKELQYIPLPDTYLRQERWEDEIIEVKPAERQTTPIGKPNELRSTVKEWGIGHPDYDRLHGLNRNSAPLLHDRSQSVTQLGQIIDRVL